MLDNLYGRHDVQTCRYADFHLHDVRGLAISALIVFELSPSRNDCPHQESLRDPLVDVMA